MGTISCQNKKSLFEKNRKAYSEIEKQWNFYIFQVRFKKHNTIKNCLFFKQDFICDMEKVVLRLGRGQTYWLICFKWRRTIISSHPNLKAKPTDHDTIDLDISLSKCNQKVQNSFSTHFNLSKITGQFLKKIKIKLVSTKIWLVIYSYNIECI